MKLLKGLVLSLFFLGSGFFVNIGSVFGSELAQKQSELSVIKTQLAACEALSKDGYSVLSGPSLSDCGPNVKNVGNAQVRVLTLRNKITNIKDSIKELEQSKESSSDLSSSVGTSTQGRPSLTNEYCLDLYPVFNDFSETKSRSVTQDFCSIYFSEKMLSISADNEKEMEEQVGLYASFITVLNGNCSSNFNESECKTFASFFYLKADESKCVVLVEGGQPVRYCEEEQTKPCLAIEPDKRGNKVKGICRMSGCKKGVESEIVSEDCQKVSEKAVCCGIPAIYKKKQPPVSHGNVLAGPSKGEDGQAYVVQRFLPSITNLMLTLLLSGSVLMLVWAGILYISSGGDSEQVEKAKTTFIWAMLGVIIGILSLTIVKLVINLEFF